MQIVPFWPLAIGASDHNYSWQHGDFPEEFPATYL
jgi:hypothetical protein